PIRSEKRAPSTQRGVGAMAKKGFDRAPSPYPTTVNAFRLPCRSLIQPEKSLEIEAADSPTPSISPTTSVLAPNVATRNTGSKLWIISEEMSINMLTKPSAHTPWGSRPSWLRPTIDRFPSMGMRITTQHCRVRNMIAPSRGPREHNAGSGNTNGDDDHAQPFTQAHDRFIPLSVT